MRLVLTHGDKVSDQCGKYLHRGISSHISVVSTQCMNSHISVVSTGTEGMVLHQNGEYLHGEQSYIIVVTTGTGKKFSYQCGEYWHRGKVLISVW